jgi:hypothetical protein
MSAVESAGNRRIAIAIEGIRRMTAGQMDCIAAVARGIAVVMA